MSAGTSFFFDTTQGSQLDLLATELDFELVAGLEIKHGGLGLAHQQISVALHGCGVAELAATFPATYAVVAKAEAFGFQQGFIESSEVQPLRTIYLGADLAAAAHQIRFGGISQFLDFGEQFRTGKHEGINILP